MREKILITKQKQATKQMYKHQLTLLIGLQKPSAALRNFFASHRSYGYDLSQEKLRSIRRMAFSPSMKGLAGV